MVQTITIFVLATIIVVAACYMLGKRLFKRDDQWERFAEDLLDLSEVLANYGLQDLPKALRLAAIKDISGAIRIVRLWIMLAKEAPETVVKKFDDVFDRVLDAKLKLPEQVALLKAKIAAVETPTGDNTKTA